MDRMAAALRKLLTITLAFEEDIRNNLKSLKISICNIMLMKADVLDEFRASSISLVF